MSEVDESLMEELRLKIAWAKGYRPVPVPYGDIKLMRPGGPPTGAFGLPNRSLEAPNWPKDLAAAFRLLNEFKDAADQVTLFRRGATWTCEITTQGSTFTSQNKIPQLAICQAYVLAKDIDFTPEI